MFRRAIINRPRDAGDSVPYIVLVPYIFISTILPTSSPNILIVPATVFIIIVIINTAFFLIMV